MPELVARHLHFFGDTEVEYQGQYLCTLINHSNLENSIFWSSNDIFGCREGLTLDLFLNIIERFPLKSFLDARANPGTYGIACLCTKTSIESVLFFEPLNCALTLLHQNLGLNVPNLHGPKTYFVYDGALAEFDGEANLHFDPKNKVQFSASLQHEFDSNNTVFTRVNVSKLSSLIDLSHLESPDIEKLDLEGSEYDALRGFEKYLMTIKFLIVEILNSQMAQSIETLFHTADYCFLDINDPCKTITMIDSLAPSTYRNVLIFRRENFIEILQMLNSMSLDDSICRTRIKFRSNSYKS